MDARNEAAAATNTSTFEPSSDLIQEEDCNTLLLYLPGFTRDQLRVQLTRTRVLKISGARPLGNNKTSSFQKDFPVAESCDASKITAKFEDGILYVRQPKTEPPKIVDHPRPPTSIADDHIKQATAAMNSPKKPLQTSQGEGGKKEEKKPAEEKTGGDGGKKEEEKKPAEENTGGDGGKKEEKKKPAEEKTARTGAEKRDRGAGSSVAAAAEAAKVDADYSRLNAASPAARLKAVKEKMTNVVLLLFVFALGIYVSKLPWFSKRAHD